MDINLTEIICAALAFSGASFHVHRLVFWYHEKPKGEAIPLQFSLVDLSAGIASAAAMQGLGSLIHPIPEWLIFLAVFACVIWCLGLFHLKAAGVGGAVSRWAYLAIFNPICYIYATINWFALIILFAEAGVGDLLIMLFILGFWLALTYLATILLGYLVSLIFGNKEQTKVR